jgi:ParB-like chromosome segregation protein Spo0J
MAMTAVKEQEFVTCHVRVDRITLGTMPRPVDPQTVAILKETITTLGLLHPPTVKKGEHDTFELLAGYHRFVSDHRGSNS